MLAIESGWPQRGHRSRCGSSRGAPILRAAHETAITLNLMCSMLAALRRGRWSDWWICLSRERSWSRWDRGSGGRSQARDVSITKSRLRPRAKTRRRDGRHP